MAHFFMMQATAAPTLAVEFTLINVDYKAVIAHRGKGERELKRAIAQSVQKALSAYGVTIFAKYIMVQVLPHLADGNSVQVVPGSTVIKATFELAGEYTEIADKVLAKFKADLDSMPGAGGDDVGRFQALVLEKLREVIEDNRKASESRNQAREEQQALAAAQRQYIAYKSHFEDMPGLVEGFDQYVGPGPIQVVNVAIRKEMQSHLDLVNTEYFRRTQDASDRLALEMKAVIWLQSFWRGWKVRQRWRAVIRSAKMVQKWSRGLSARCRTRMLRRERIRRQNLMFFNHSAAVIQKFFRGWWSRRHLHNYYGRKGYLEKVAKRGDWTRSHLQRDHAMKVQAAKMEEETQMRQEFNGLCGELHHLVSTKSIAGVYNPPYNDVLPRAFERPIEQHLRDSLQVRLPRSLRRPRHPSTGASPRHHGYGATQNDHMHSLGQLKGPPQDLPDRIPHHSRSASVGRMQNIQGPFRSREQIEVSNAKAHNNFRSIQSQSKYDTVDDDRKMQQRLTKLTRVSPIDFMSPGMPPMNPAPTSVHTAVPYREKPCELRSDYVELPKIRDKPPFFTAAGGGRNFEDHIENNLLPFGHV